MTVSFLFVHSPLLGPSSLQRLADLASASGVGVAVPDLTPMATAAHPHKVYVDRAIEAGRGLASPVAVIGHSGAGPFLPSIAAGIGVGTIIVFLDAVVPPESGAHRTSEALSKMLDEQTVDGILRRWLEWWPSDVVSDILPDPVDRDQIARDMPNLPRTFYDHGIPVSPRWSEQPCGYLRLSASYNTDYAKAVARGWPAQRLTTTHLAPFTEPSEVLDAIDQLVDEITSWAR